MFALPTDLRVVFGDVYPAEHGQDEGSGLAGPRL